jgi:hypothetical protein
MNLLARLRRRRAAARSERPLHLCEVCRSRLVTTLHSQPWEDERSLVVLRCAECGHERTGLFGHEACGFYDLQQDAAAYALRSSLRALQARRAHEELAERVERFIGALRADAIDPEDFAQPPSAA